MLEWVSAIAVSLVAGGAIGIMMRRDRMLFAWFRAEMAGLRQEVDQARIEVRSLGGPQGETILESVEGEDLEIANNLDRMNLLLDRLNGLLKGRIAEPQERRRIVFHEEQASLPSGLDFASPEELRKFTNLPPLSSEEIESIDWDYLFNRLRTDDLE